VFNPGVVRTARVPATGRVRDHGREARRDHRVARQLRDRAALEGGGRASARRAG
jgi:hypothetical protein